MPFISHVQFTHAQFMTVEPALETSHAILSESLYKSGCGYDDTRQTDPSVLMYESRTTTLAAKQQVHRHNIIFTHYTSMVVVMMTRDKRIHYIGCPTTGTSP